MFLIILISLVISATQGCWWNYQRKIPNCPHPPLTPHGGTRECEVEDLVYLSGNSCVFTCRTTGETITSQCSPGLPGTWSPAPYFSKCCPLVASSPIDVKQDQRLDVNYGIGEPWARFGYNISFEVFINNWDTQEMGSLIRFSQTSLREVVIYQRIHLFSSTIDYNLAFNLMIFSYK